MDKIIMKIFNFLEIDKFYVIKFILIGIPFLILLTIFVFIPYWFINLFKK